LIALSSQMRERLRGALHMGVKRALAVISSHYVGVDLPAISDGYVLPDDDEEADAAVMKLMEAAEGPSMTLATLSMVSHSLIRVLTRTYSFFENE